MYFAIMALPALLVCVFMRYYYKHEITAKEFGIHFIGALAAAGIMLGITYASIYASMYDTEVLNGKVLSKSRHVETCTEYSSCKYYTWHERCYRDSKNKKHCTSYKVFDYVYEVDWRVKTSVDSHTIERVNRQGTLMPDRWAKIEIGEPASTTHSYINYLLGNEDSLFYEKQYEALPDAKKQYLPVYPKIYDYYRINHVINLTKLSDSGYNDYINDVLRDLGAEKQVNIVMVMYDFQNKDTPESILAKWRGGKKNDVIMFFGLDEEGVVRDFSSTSFANGMNNEFLHSTLRVHMLTEKINLDLVKSAVYTISQDFKRLPNEEFEYLKYKLEPSIWVVILCSFISGFISVMIGIYMRRVDL